MTYQDEQQGPGWEACWVVRMKAGDSAAFAAVVEAYRPRLYAYCRARLGNADDAEDLTQETFLRAYRALPRVDDDLPLSPWLYRIATNACNDTFRRRRTAWHKPWDDSACNEVAARREDNPESALLNAEARRSFARTCDTLRPHHRRVLLLRGSAGLSLAEIGARLDLTPQAVKSLLFRARREYRERQG